MKRCLVVVFVWQYSKLYWKKCGLLTFTPVQEQAECCWDGRWGFFFEVGTPDRRAGDVWIHRDVQAYPVGALMAPALWYSSGGVFPFVGLVEIRCLHRWFVGLAQLYTWSEELAQFFDNCHRQFACRGMSCLCSTTVFSITLS